MCVFQFPPNNVFSLPNQALPDCLIAQGAGDRWHISDQLAYHRTAPVRQPVAQPDQLVC